MDEDEPGVNDDGAEDLDGGDTLYLEPAAWQSKGKAKWKASRRTITAAVNPVGGETLAWIAKAVGTALP